MSRRVVHRRLHVEELEPRVAPAALTGSQVYEFKEADGDLIGISLEGPGEFNVLSGTNGASIYLQNTDLTSSLSVVVRETVGDGAANLGDVNAEGLALGALNIEGNVTHVVASVVGEVNISGEVSRTMSLDRMEAFTSISVGGLYALDVGGGLNGSVTVGGSAMAINVGTGAKPTFEITQITNDDSNNVDPVVNGGKIAFISINNSKKTDLPGTLMVWDGTQLIEVAEGATHPSLYGNQVAFVHGTGQSGAIFLAEIGETPVHIANGTSPSLWNGKIAFVSGQNDKSEIYLYDGDNIIQITDNDTADSQPCLWGDVISWTGVDPVEGDTEIFMYKDGQIIQITNNSVDDSQPFGPPNFLTFVTVDPEEGDTEIALYDGFAVRMITDNSVDDSRPTYSCIAYQSGVGDDAQVAYWNKVTSTIVDQGENPFLKGGLIAYQKYDGNDYEIYVARVEHVPGPSSTGTVKVTGSLDSFATTGSLSAKSSVQVGGDLGFVWSLGDMRGTIKAGGDLVSRAILKGALAGRFETGGDMLGQVSIASPAGLTGSLIAGGTISNVAISSGDLDGVIRAGGDLGIVTIGGNLDGKLMTYGTTTGRTLVKGDLNGLLYAKGGTGAQVTVMGDLNGILRSGDDILGNVVVYGDLSGSIITSKNIVGNVVVRGENGITEQGLISAGRQIIGNISIPNGDLAGRVLAFIRTGNLTVGGDLSGAVTSKNSTTGKTCVKGDLTGVLDAGRVLGGNVSVKGNLAGQILATQSIAGNIAVTGNLSGKIACSSGSILSTIAVNGVGGVTETGRIYAGKAIGGVISVRNGDFAGTIEARDLSGRINLAHNVIGAGAIRIANNITSTGVISIGGDVLTPGSKSISIGNNVAGKIWIKGTHQGILEVGRSILAGGVVRANGFDQVEIGLLHKGGTVQAGGKLCSASKDNGSLTIGGKCAPGSISYRTNGWDALRFGANI